MKEIEKVVSDNVKRLIDEYNLTHQDLATIADVSVSTVGKWILKKATPRMGAIQKISDHFQIPKSYILEEEYYELPSNAIDFPYFPAHISAGLPFTLDSAEATTISISDEVLGRYKDDKDIFFARINGDSMNKIMNDGTLIAIKPMPITSLNNGDIVVFSTDHEYSVKHYYRYGDALVFKPNSHDIRHKEQEYSINDNITIHGKVITYIINLD